MAAETVKLKVSVKILIHLWIDFDSVPKFVTLSGTRPNDLLPITEAIVARMRGFS